MICAVYRNKVGFFASYFMSVSNSIRERILLLKIKHGDAGAYAELYDFYVEPIYRYVLFRVPAKELAEDVTSEVFLKVWERLSGGSEVQNLRAYLYQVARNQIADYFRKDHQATLPVEMVDEKQTTAESVELERQITLADIETSLRQLPPHWQEIIVLVHVEGLKLKEAAAIIGRSHGATRALLHRALNELKKLINR